MNNPAYNPLPQDNGGYQQSNQYGQPNYQAPPQNQYQGYVPPQNFTFPSQLRGIEKLAPIQAVYIKQKFQVWEALTGCQQNNVFFVYPADPSGAMIPNSSPLFLAKQNSECCQRILCPADMRAFAMDIFEYADGVDSKGNPNKVQVMKFEREYKFTCCCFNRPQLKVHKIDQGYPSPLGRIFSPYLVCRLGVDIFTKDDVPKYTVDGSVCQCGILCKTLPCGPCQKAKFDVLDYQSRQPIVPLYKKNAGCCKACVESISDFSVIFPGDSNTEDKALLLASAIFIDYRYFEENELNDKNKRR